jgi:hypothetical protein
MSVQIHGNPKVFFGARNKNLPKLPDRFRYVEHPKNWLTATDGIHEYFVTQDALIRMRYTSADDVRRTNGRLKLGETWMDHGDTIQLGCTPPK